MNFHYEDIARPVYKPTGYDHIDRGFAHQQVEAPSSNWLSFKQLADPISVKLASTRSDVEAQTGQALSAEFDFWTLANAYAVDSYLSTAVDKYMRLIPKEGWTIKGKNKAAIDYINQRIALLKVATGKTFQETLTDVEYCTVLFANAFLVKVPFKGNSPIPGMKLQSIKGHKPIGGIFPVHPGRMKPTLDDKGKITQWAFVVSGNEKETFKPDEVIHVACNRPPNYLYGQPHFLSVLEDIRTYRQLEYLTVMLLNRYLHPLVHVRKGIDPSGKHVFRVTGADLQEVDAALRSASADGIFITGPDVQIDVKGVESQAIRASEYLGMWRKRIFAGLAVSDIAMGESGAGTRSSADAITAEMHDTALGYQRAIAEALNSSLIFYWLIEGGFDPITEPQCAYFAYHSVALEEEIKKRNQTIQEWFAGLTTHEEFREAMGLQPLTDADLEKTYLALPLIFQAKYGVTASSTNPAQGSTSNAQTPKKSAPKTTKPTKSK